MRRASNKPLYQALTAELREALECAVVGMVVIDGAEGSGACVQINASAELHRTYLLKLAETLDRLAADLRLDADKSWPLPEN